MSESGIVGDSVCVSLCVCVCVYVWCVCVCKRDGDSRGSQRVTEQSGRKIGWHLRIKT